MKKVKLVQTNTKGVSICDTGLPGPTVGIMGGVHGDELSGKAIVENFQSNGISIGRGKLILIVGNPIAVNKRVRFTEVNLNRKFRDLSEDEQKLDFDKLPYETSRAQELLPFLCECESLLDLHEHHSPELGTFVICEPPSYEIVKKIGSPIVSFGWSTSEAGGSDGYMAGLGKTGICCELGYVKNTDKNIIYGNKVVNRFLSAHNMIEGKFQPLSPSSKTKYVQALYSYVRKNKQFKFSRPFKSFELLKEGELIAQDGTKKLFARKNEIIIFPGEDNPIGTETFTIGLFK